MCGWYLVCGRGTCAIEYVCARVMQHVSENTSPIVIISCFAEEWMLCVVCVKSACERYLIRGHVKRAIAYVFVM